ncbi:MAG: NAD-dependent malic enzyme [Candidatus Marinimicrobia bacterium]|jgi:malate dehydrogenase (oxaloacetate-decarboxylating)(NADP+)|nr:NAD-dependent malic enzyme [Candidatus Neomarinimicrobiota bacterium]MBT3675948.1 NAD-dependent malic enzyme [Candidatus Neomarinimicrobiota bacterium]MBT3762690.1 NAD-dependent malic enzyme [Candidatus Neomarinimicrobiota bacterium]MBT4068330.1 NAD-dependent malic enzyme [Candidatus Neomarinimicrobiota bacterium]MBT4271097.1 NAD-dependent malic enzyme [Candidatus Neomarinimicrobiota bacterium]
MKNIQKDVKGVDLLHNPLLNKGTAFSSKERILLKLEGLLPPHISTQSEQKMKVLSTVRSLETDMAKYIYLMSLQDRNETLFYRLIMDEIEEFLPIIYTPTVGQACQEYGHIFRRPRGMYISNNDKGCIETILKNWPRNEIDVIVVTDGERILGLGDLGADGMGIPVGKLSLYTVCAGIDPRKTIPITIDVGTNNNVLLEDPLYIGLRHKRIVGDEFDQLIDEFMDAVSKVFPNALVQFEDFANQNAYRLLEKYRYDYCSFNDDIQGTGSVVLAGLFTAMKNLESSLSEQCILFYGAGSAAIGIAEDIATAKEMAGVSPQNSRENIYLFDSRGLVVKGRDHLTVNKEKFAHSITGETNFLEVVKKIKPTVIIGVAGQPNVFTIEVIKAMAKNNENPIIFALSNPTTKSECTAEEAYKWSDGKALFASGSPFNPVKFKGKTFYSGQGNNAYIFPGLGMGIVISRASRVVDEMLIIAAQTLGAMVSFSDFDEGRLYPPLTNIREISIQIAIAIAEYVFDNNLAQVPRPENIEQTIRKEAYIPDYVSYV